MSDAPDSFDRDVFRHVLATAVIDGQPALDLSRASDQKLLDRFVSIVDAPQEQAGSIEWRDSILKRTEGAKVVTDDNMECEWENDGNE